MAPKSGDGFFRSLLGHIRDEDRRAHEKRSRRDAERTAQQIENTIDPTAFRSGGIGNWQHVAGSNSLNIDGRGWYVGILWVGDEAYPVYYDAPRPISIEGMPGVGKGVSIATNIAHLAGQASLAVVDYDNDGYNTGADHWRTVCGENSVVQIDLERPERGQINPLAYAIHLAATGQFSLLLDEINEVVETLMPDPEKTGDNHWILRDARELAELVICVFARFAPDYCYLPYLDEICGRTFPDLIAALRSFLGEEINDPHVADKLSKYLTLYESKPEHGAWFLQEITGATRYFGKQTRLGQVLLGNSVDYSQIKQQSTFVSIGLDKGKIKQRSRAVALISRSITVAAAAATGPMRTYVVFDEAPTYKVDLPTWCRSLRSLNVVPVIAYQNEASMQDRYGENAAKDIFSTCGLRQWLSITESSVADDLEKRGGTRPSTVRLFSTNQGPVEQGGQSTSTRSEPNLKSADLLLLEASQHRTQIVYAPGHPVFVLGWEPWWEIEPWCHQLRTYEQQAQAANHG